VKRTYKVRCNDEVEAQRRRWTFYETIKFNLSKSGPQRGKTLIKNWAFKLAQDLVFGV
jgi:hypothetical protein